MPNYSYQSQSNKLPESSAHALSTHSVTLLDILVLQNKTLHRELA